MLRTLFVSVLILAGIYYSLQGPFFILLFYLWNAYFRPESWAWSTMVYELRLSLTIGIMLVLASIPSLTRFRLTAETFLIILFAIQCTVSWLLSPYVNPIGIYWGELMKVLIVTLLITVLVDDVKKFRLALIVVAFSLGLEAAKQGWAQMILNPGGTNTNTHVLLGDNNGVAMGMMMLVPVFLALAQTAKAPWERNIHRFFLIGVLYRGISTYSRGGLIAAAAIGLIFLARSKHKVRGFVLVGALSLGIVTLMPPAFWERMNTITASEDDRDASAQSRLYFWELARQMADDHPLTGVGPNAFRFAFPAYDDSEGAFGELRAVHSVWFGLMSDLGYPGLVLFCALVAVVLFRFSHIQMNARHKQLGEIVIYARCLQISLVAFVVGGTFLSAHYLELIWHFFGLSVALARICETSAATVAAEDPAVDPRPRRLVVSVQPALPSGPARPARPAGAGGRRFFDEPNHSHSD